MKKTNKNGFVMVVTILLSVLVGIIGFIAMNTILKVDLYAQSQKTIIESQIKAQDIAYTQLKYDSFLNQDGLGMDVTFCSGGLILNTDNGMLCSTQVEQGIDTIDDACNNDDRSPYFYDKNIQIHNFIDGKLYDNDANARIYKIGFVYPQQKQTIFYYDKTIKDTLLSNSANNYFGFPIGVNNLKLKGEFFGTGTGELSVYSVNKSLGINTQFSSNISLSSSGLISENGTVGAGKPWIINTNNDNYIYAINLVNNSTQVLGYTLSLVGDDTTPMYQVPISYKGNNISMLYYDFGSAESIKSYEIFK